MKTSIKLLLGLALFLVVAMFGAAISLRHQYDSFDKKDRYARWQKKPLPAFHAVQLTGPSASIVQIEPGPTTRLLTDSLRDWKKTSYTYRVERDTLFLQLKPIEGWKFNVYAKSDDWQEPQIVVQLPRLLSVSTANALCQLHDFRGNVLTLRQGGNGGTIVLNRMTYNQLNAALSMANQLTLKKSTNTIGKAAISLRDSSRLFQYGDFQQGLTLIADSTAQVRLTGKALQQLQR